ncbi:hypothetical protein M0R45_008048 [Rubus argutus]|uniref:Nucleotide-diphospho-sugar transferase domain-containing protein n=1 Tax=Rubus argutus TaxID=59490 RepID=A0AAW1Y0I8_RUBAR
MSSKSLTPVAALVSVTVVGTIPLLVIKPHQHQSTTTTMDSKQNETAAEASGGDLLGPKAYARCLALHPHCYQLYTQGADFTSEAAFMSSDYLHMMWRRIQILTSILEKGYSFVFTDTDIMWLRDPFQQFFPNADFQIACDYFRGDSYDVNSNLPNGGFTYVISNQRTIKFYNFWHFSRKAYPNNHDQDVLNKIKSDPFISSIGLKMRFLDTKYFGGFCQPSKDFNLVCTMHANCCVGLDNKVNDLKILLQNWRNYMALPPPSSTSPNSNTTTPRTMPSWTVPQNCSTSFQRRGVGDGTCCDNKGTSIPTNL